MWNRKLAGKKAVSGMSFMLSLYFVAIIFNLLTLIFLILKLLVQNKRLEQERFLKILMFELEQKIAPDATSNTTQKTGTGNTNGGESATVVIVFRILKIRECASNSLAV